MHTLLPLFCLILIRPSMLELIWINCSDESFQYLSMIFSENHQSLLLNIKLAHTLSKNSLHTLSLVPGCILLLPLPDDQLINILLRANTMIIFTERIFSYDSLAVEFLSSLLHFLFIPTRATRSLEILRIELIEETQLEISLSD